MKRVIESDNHGTDSQKFGYGESKFKNYDDWPVEYIDEDGRFWTKLPRTIAMSEYIETGMPIVDYSTDDPSNDLLLYIDARGQVWNEYVDGIL